MQHRRTRTHWPPPMRSHSLIVGGRRGLKCGPAFEAVDIVAGGSGARDFEPDYSLPEATSLTWTGVRLMPTVWSTFTSTSTSGPIVASSVVTFIIVFSLN